MTIRRELIDELFKEYQTPQDVLGEDGLLKPKEPSSSYPC